MHLADIDVVLEDSHEQVCTMQPLKTLLTYALAQQYRTHCLLLCNQIVLILCRLFADLCIAHNLATCMSFVGEGEGRDALQYFEFGLLYP